MILRQCNVCRSLFSFRVDPEDLEDWKNGKLIQEAMPYLTPGERELMISGTCEDCFKKIFAVVD